MTGGTWQTPAVTRVHDVEVLDVCSGDSLAPWLITEAADEPGSRFFLVKGDPWRNGFEAADGFFQRWGKAIMLLWRASKTDWCRCGLEFQGLLTCPDHGEGTTHHAREQLLTQCCFHSREGYGRWLLPALDAIECRHTFIVPTLFPHRAHTMALPDCVLVIDQPEDVP